MQVCIIVGIRSHYIKLAGLELSIRQLRSTGQLGSLEFINVNAGQHYDWELSNQYADEYCIKFAVEFASRFSDFRPHFVLGQMIGELEEYLSCNPNIRGVIVFGDANASLAGSIAAKRTQRKLFHVEAGLRTGDQINPEELNRVLIDRVADWHFASSLKDLGNLRSEGLYPHVVFAGDVVKDLVCALPVIKRPPKKQAFVCIHRKENLNDIELMDECISSLKMKSIRPIFLSHPATRASAELVAQKHQVELLGSIGHLATLQLVSDSIFGITDSGALQREAYYLNRRLLIRQNNPFWSSLIDNGFHRAVARTKLDIEEGIDWALKANSERIVVPEEYGDGNAGQIILNSILSTMGEGR